MLVRNWIYDQYNHCRLRICSPESSPPNSSLISSHFYPCKSILSIFTIMWNSFTHSYPNPNHAAIYKASLSLTLHKQLDYKFYWFFSLVSFPISWWRWVYILITSCLDYFKTLLSICLPGSLPLWECLFLKANLVIPSPLPIECRMKPSFLAKT